MMGGLMAFFASFGFGILFNIRKDKLFVAGLVGAAGGLCYKGCLLQGFSETLALFCASLLISFLSDFFARRLKCPATTFLICALIPLVPGGGMYYTMLEIVANNYEGALFMGIQTIIQACSIVIGCTLVSSCSYTFNQFLKRKYSAQSAQQSEN